MVDAEDLPTIGETIGGYRLDRLIATGGMGAVFRAVHTKLGRKAAVKVLDRALATDAEFVSRFLHEARVVNDVRHPNIVDIYDFYQEDDRVAFVMELLEGPTLARALLKRKTFSTVQALNVTRQLLDALEAVHGAGVVHRDLKPQNILITAPLTDEFWEVPSVKILDFGIAKHKEADVQHRTTTGSIMGTPAYMAPEQVAAAPVSPATDLYAVAELLFEMVSGRRLFDGENLEILGQKLKQAPPDLSLPPEVRGGDTIVALTRMAIAPDPEDRPSTADFKRAVEELVEEVSGLNTQDMVSDDGVQTILSLDAPNFDTLLNDDDEVETDSGLDQPFHPTENDPGMNTQMFLDRIAEDIADVHRPETPPPQIEPEPLPSLKLDLGHAHHPNTSYEAKAPPTGRPPIVRGRPESVKPKKRSAPPPNQKSGKRFLWLLLGPALILIALVAVPGLGARAIATVESIVGVTPNPVRLRLAEFKERHPSVSGSAADHINAALEAHMKDSWSGYAEAETEIEKALILEPKNPTAIALYAENGLIAREGLLTDSEGAELAAYVSYLEAQGVDPTHSVRARALLAKAHGQLEQCRKIAETAQANRPDPLAMLIEADCGLEADPAAAEALIWRASQERALPRGERLLARARARAGRYPEALASLKKRVDADPKSGLLLLEQARILHAIGEHDDEVKALRAATRGDGDQLRAQLLLGRAQAELRKVGSAKSTLNSLATNEHAPSHYRRDAYVAMAELLLDEKSYDEVEALVTAAEEIGLPVMQAERLKAEASLGLGRFSEVATEAAAVLQHGAKEPLQMAYLLVGAHVGRGRPDEAKPVLQSLLTAKPKDPRGPVHLAAARALLDDFAGARAQLETLTKLDVQEILDDDRRMEVPRPTRDIFETQLQKALPGSADAACVHTVLAYLAFFDRDRSAAEAQIKLAIEKTKPPPAAWILASYAGLDSRTRKTVHKRLKEMDPSVGQYLSLARAGLSKSGFDDALVLDPDLLLARVERASRRMRKSTDKGAEELRVLHVAYPHSAKLRAAMMALKK